MGARCNFIFKQNNVEPSVILYSHWGADSWESDLAAALKAAEPRWNDPSYATRIAISSLIGDNWQSETGYGIHTAAGEDYTFLDQPILINFVTLEVTELARDPHPMSAFVAYHMKTVDA
jgi:hypothetical protein